MGVLPSPAPSFSGSPQPWVSVFGTTSDPGIPERRTLSEAPFDSPFQGRLPSRKEFVLCAPLAGALPLQVSCQGDTAIPK